MNRTIINVTLFLLGAFVSSVTNADDQIWTLPENPPCWARNPEGFHAEEKNENGVRFLQIIHKTDTDWATRIPGQIDVEPGQVFTLKAKIKNIGESACQTGVVLYDKQGDALDWSYGGVEVQPSPDWQITQSRFIVPHGVAKIEARVIGSRDTNVAVASYSIERSGEITPPSSTEETIIENAYLRLRFDSSTGAFSIRDLRTNREWRQSKEQRFLFVKDVVKDDLALTVQLIDGQTFSEFQARVELEKDKPELVARIIAPAELALEKSFDYPFPIQSSPTDRIVLPVNEGVSFPARDEASRVERMHTYGGHGLCSAFWAIVDDVLDASQSSGIMGIIETPDDCVVETRLRSTGTVDETKEERTLAIGCQWQPSMKKFRYNRTLRIIALEKGGYVAACKRYREYAKEIGLLVTFDEKIARNPNLAEGVDLLIGAANIWNWDGRGLESVAKLKEAGIDRILWSGGGDARTIEALNREEGVLTSRYDIYQDVMNPERYDEIQGVHGDWIPEAWPKDIAWDDPNGNWTRGWSVDAKDPTKPRVPCGVLCDLKAVEYAEKRIGDELKTKPYRARFLDTTVASPWRECWNPEHPTTRSQSKEERMKLLGLLGERFNLICGSETGIDASVPYCDFYEGMMSLGPYRCPESGRYLTRIWDEVPEEVEKYQMGEEYRLPLFELIYHGCVVSYWYWGDHNNKFPKLWRKRDLFNALYATPPMYCFTNKFFDENRERFIESYKTAEPASRLTGRVEMTDHQVLTQDRKVQKTVFANGVEVFVNFGATEYVCEDGVVLPPESSRIVEP